MMRRMMIALVMLGAAVPVAPAMAQSGLIHAKTADYEFAYRYPSAVTRIPALRHMLDAEAATLQRKTAQGGADERRESKASNYPFRPHSYEKTWKVVTETLRFLSLSSDSYDYTGGAHGSPGSSALLWDKAAGRRLEPRSVFASVAALQAATRTDYCARLKAEQLRRNQGNVSSMNICPPLKDLTLLLGSSKGRAIDRIGLVADPYVAGSYAEGAYEVTLPVTRAILATVRPAYRGAFGIGR